MSYFMTIAGPKVDLGELPSIELLPASQAQEYIRKREAELIRLDGAPLFLVHDCKSGTSEGIVGEVWNRAQAGKSLQGSTLSRFISLVQDSEHVLRIWMADNRPDAHLGMAECKSMEDMWARLTKGDVQLRVRLTSAGTGGGP